MDPILQEFAVQSFSRDAAVAASLEASIHVTSLFEPLLAGASEFKHDSSGGPRLTWPCLTSEA
jgi:hypothetical protein